MEQVELGLSLLTGEVVCFLLLFEVGNVELDLVFGVFEKSVYLVIELAYSSRERGSGRGDVFLLVVEFDVTSETFVTFGLFMFFFSHALLTLVSP